MTNEPPSPTVGSMTVEVVVADEQTAVDVDVDRWSRLAHDVLVDEGRVGELTLTFVDAAEIIRPSDGALVARRE